MEKLLTLEEVAGVNQLSKATIYAYVAAKKIPYIKLGFRSRLKIEQIQNWIDERSVNTIRLGGD